VNSDARRLPASRKADLSTYVSEMGQVTVAMLADRFDVSTDTIRRDLDQLHDEGVLIRTHGGAVSLETVPHRDAGLNVRLRLQTHEKERIGELAAGLVTDGSVIIINAGTTTLSVARHLKNHRDLTIATNNLLMPSEVSPKVFRELYVFGGAVRTITQATTGPVRFQTARTGRDLDIRCDLALIAVGAVSVDAGYSTSNLSEGEMMGEMIDRAARVAILADSSKFGRSLFARVAELERADYFVTDAPPPPDLAAALRAGEVSILTS
jgi:DeoR family fructose operon transcriptional repressor